jgi:phage FluMu protein Com
MAIEFHCDHCGKLIRAPQDAAGRRGKCPACKQPVYIKTPSEDIEEIGLAPIDDEAEAAEAKAKREAQRLARNLLREQAEVPDAPGGGSESDMIVPASTLSTAEVTERVVAYLQALAGSNLDAAEEIVDALRSQKTKTLDVVERIGQDSIPPAGLEAVPPAVLNGFLNSLRSQL